MGVSTHEVFNGESGSNTVKEIYGKSAALFADIIKNNLPPTSAETPQTLIDIGASKGELLSNIVKLLPEYSFDVIATETNEAALNENNTTKNKIVADAESMPIADGSIDIVLMRYVLQFNQLEAQERIIKEISRMVRGIGIIQHGGSDDSAEEEWRSRVEQIFHSDELPQLKRDGMFYSSSAEIENIMQKNKLNFEKVQSNKIGGLSEAFIERYSLNAEQSQYLKNLLGDKDYIIQTTWVIHPPFIERS